MTRRGTTGEVAPIPADVEVVPNSVTESFQQPQGAGALVTRRVGKIAKCPPYALALNTVAYPEGKPWLILNFQISSLTGHEEQLDPADLQVFERKTPLVIEDLYLESLKLPSDGSPIHGTAMLQRKAPSRVTGLALVLKARKQAKGGCSEMKITLSAAKRAKGAIHGEKGKN